MIAWRLLLCLIGALAATRATAWFDVEAELKSACVFNFTKYATFQYPEGKIVVGIAGDEALVPTLKHVLAGKVVEGHAFSVREVSDAGDMRGCSVVFICSSEADHVTKITTDLKGTPVLTVGDTAGYAQKGVMINISIEDNHVRFIVNNGFARASHVGISSKLLQLAQSVIGG